METGVCDIWIEWRVRDINRLVAFLSRRRRSPQTTPTSVNYSRAPWRKSRTPSKKSSSSRAVRPRAMRLARRTMTSPSMLDFAPGTPTPRSIVPHTADAVSHRMAVASGCWCIFAGYDPPSIFAAVIGSSVSLQVLPRYHDSFVSQMQLKRRVE